MSNLTDRERLPPELVTEPITCAIVDALRDMGDQAMTIMLAVGGQFSAATATWGLSAWERISGITPDPGATLESRRGAVMQKLTGTGTTTAETLRQLSIAITGYDAQITEHTGEYTVELTFLGEETGYLISDLPRLYQEADIVLPAHIRFMVSPLTWEVLETVGMTWEQMELQTLTWGDLEIAGRIQPRKQEE